MRASIGRSSLATRYSRRIQRSLQPPPWLEFTTRLPLRSATRQRPPGTTCCLSRPCRTNGRRSTWRGSNRERVAGAHDVGPAHRHVGVVRHLHFPHLEPVRGTAQHEVGRNHAVPKRLSVVIDVVQEEVEGGETLSATRPSRGGGPVPAASRPRGTTRRGTTHPDRSRGTPRTPPRGRGPGRRTRDR